MGLHALQSLDEESLAVEINLALRGDDCTLTFAPRPEGVSHGAPRIIDIIAVDGGAVLADDEGGRQPSDGDVNKTGFVDSGLDGVGGSIFVELNGKILTAK